MKTITRNTLVLSFAISLNCLAQSPAPATTTSTASVEQKDGIAIAKLPAELSKHLLNKAIGFESTSLADMALKHGADLAVLEQSNSRLQKWDFLQLYEKYLRESGQDMSYRAEDWARVFHAHGDYWINTDNAKLIVAHLKSKGVDINAASSEGTPLSLALSIRQLSLVEILIAEGADLSLLSAEEQGKFEELKSRASKVYTPNPRSTENMSPEEAATHVLRLALKSMEPAELDAAMKQVRALARDTEIIDDALVEQACWGTAEAIRYLVSQGADVNAMGTLNEQEMRTALSLATSRYSVNKDAIRALEELGGRYLINPATSTHSRFLKGKGINAQTEAGRSPLMLHLSDSLSYGTKDFSRPDQTVLYLELGADPTLSDANEQHALFYSCKRGDGTVYHTELLIKAGCNVNQLDKAGRSALFEAVESGAVLTTLLLLNEGSDPWVVDKFGKSLLDCHANKTSYILRKEMEKNTENAKEIVRYFQKLKGTKDSGETQNKLIRLQLEQAESLLSSASDTIVSQSKLALNKAALSSLDVLKTQLATLEARFSVLSLNRLVGVNVPPSAQLKSKQRELAAELCANLKTQIALLKELNSHGFKGADEIVFTELKLCLFELDNHELLELDKRALEKKACELMGGLSALNEDKSKSGL